MAAIAVHELVDGEVGLLVAEGGEVLEDEIVSPGVMLPQRMISPLSIKADSVLLLTPSQHSRAALSSPTQELVIYACADCFYCNCTLTTAVGTTRATPCQNGIGVGESIWIAYRQRVDRDTRRLNAFLLPTVVHAG